MSGISLYNPTMRAGVNPGQAGVQSANLDVASAYKRNNPFEGVQELGKGVLALGKHYVDTRRIEDVTEQTNLFMKDLSSFKIDYMKNNKGKDAVEAGAAFEAYASERLGALEGESKLDWHGRIMLARTTGPTAVSFIGQGQAYGMQQENAHKETVASGAIATLNQFVAENYANADLVTAQRDITKTQLAGMYPGLDMTAKFAAIDQQTTADRIGAYMAAGDMGNAKALFTRERASLGSRADEVAMRIANKEESNLRMALAYDSKRESAQRRADAAISTKAQKDMVDALISDNIPAAEDVLAANRAFMTADEYKSYAHAIRKPVAAASDNLYAMRPLLAMQYSAEPKARALLPAAAEQAYLQGDITGGTYKDFVSTTVSAGDIAAAKGIDAALEPFAKDDPTSGLSRQKALAEFGLWSRNNAEATYEQRLAKGLEIGRNYATLDLDRMNSSLRYNSYVRKSDYSAVMGSGQVFQFLDQTEERIRNDAAENKISQADALRMNAELSAMRSAAERTLKAQKDAAAAKPRTR